MSDEPIFGLLSPAGRLVLERELTRRRIARTIAQASPAMSEQAGRMDVIGRGGADPDPERDAAFVDEIERELREKGELR